MLLELALYWIRHVMCATVRPSSSERQLLNPQVLIPAVLDVEHEIVVSVTVAIKTTVNSSSN